MKHTQHFSRALRRLGALVLAAALAMPTVHASAGEHVLETSATLVEGLDYVNTVTDHPEGGRVESFSLELQPDSQAFPILIQSSGTIYSAATVNKAVERAQSMGYQVLGAINTDYFSAATGVPMGIAIEDGVYKSSPEGENALTITQNQFGLVEDPQVTITLTNARTGAQTALTHLNKWRSSSGGLYLLNENFSTVSTRTSTSGWMVRMEQVEGGPLTVSGQITLRVTELLQTSEAVTIGEGNYILTADDASGLAQVFQSFQVGDEITLTTQCSDPGLVQAQWASGAGDVMLRGGALTDTSSWIHVNEGRAPRTALGVRADGSAVLYVVDGRQSSYSGGLSQVDVAKELQKQGCLWAVNLDGGGSSSMSVWLPGQSGPEVVSRPSDGKLRSCATFLLLVTEPDGSGRPDRLALKNDGLVVLTGTSVDLGAVCAVDEKLNPLSQSVDDAVIRSGDGLGQVEGTVYTAWDQAGTDTLLLSSYGLGVQGTAQIHVVDQLTELTITDSASGQGLEELVLDPGEQVSLDANGSYWGRAAVRDQSGVTWSVQGDVGTIDENGVFTAGGTGGAAGSITAVAGGLTRTIPVTVKNLHVDVDESHWAYVAVEYCYEQKLVSGVSADCFGPDLNIRRGDFLLMLYRFAGSPAVSTAADFPDVSPSDYYATAIAWAQENGLASGMADGTFAPNINVTREQAFTILNRALPLLGIQCVEAGEEVLDQFSDRAEVASWAAPHAASLVANQIVGGSGGKINPKGNLTRAEMAALLYKLGHYDPSDITPVQPAEPSGDNAPQGIALSHTDVTLQPGEQLALSASLTPEGAQGEVQWTAVSGVSGVVGLDSQGLVTNLNTSGQSVAVTVTASCGELYASCTVRCLPAQHPGRVSEQAETLNVRSGPGTEYEVLDRVSQGTSVVILEQTGNGWLRVRYLSQSGAAAEGYVSGEYISRT